MSSDYGVQEKLAKVISGKHSYSDSDVLSCVSYIYGVYKELFNRLTRTADVTATENAVRHFMQVGFKSYVEALIEGGIKESDNRILIKAVDVPINVCGDILVRMFKMGQLSDEEWKALYTDLKDAGSIIIDELLI